MKPRDVLLIAILCSSFAAAAQVIVLDIAYDGSITVRNSTVKYGYYPAYHDGDYRVELLSGSRILESFNFEAPNEMNVDATEDGELRGGKIILRESSFALVLPYYTGMDKIVFYKDETQIGSFIPSKEEASLPLWPIFAFFGMIAAIVIGIYLKNKAK